MSGFHYQHAEASNFHSRKRYCSDHFTMRHSPTINEPCFVAADDESRTLRSPPPDSFLSPLYSHLPSHQLPSSSGYASPAISNYVGQHTLSHHHSDPSLAEYSSVAISHGLGPRPYSAQPVTRTLYGSGDEVRIVSYHGDGFRRHSSATLSHQYGSSPSPPLLTTPYHPPPDSMHGVHKANSSSTPPINPSLPALVYESDDELNQQDDRY